MARLKIAPQRGHAVALAEIMARQPTFQMTCFCSYSGQQTRARGARGCFYRFYTFM
jgi:hypothetical protein